MATKANVSKGLISQIENNRTIPSLPVLMNIVHSLELNLDDFFKDISPQNNHSPVVVIKSADYQPFKKEPARDFLYKRILTRDIQSERPG